MKPTRVRSQDETNASILAGVRQTRVGGRNRDLQTSCLTPVEHVIVLAYSKCVKNQWLKVLFFCMCATKLNREMSEGMRQRKGCQRLSDFYL